MLLLTLSTDNTLTLPVEIREHLGLRLGDEIALELGEGSVILRRQQPTCVASPPSTFREAANRKNLETPIQYIKGVGPKVAEALARLNITTVEDALYLVPNRYEDRRELRKIVAIRPGLLEVFCGAILSTGSQQTKGGKTFFEAIIGDDSGSITCKWFHFNARYMTNTWRVGRTGVFTGEVTQFGYQREVHHPDVEWLAEGEDPSGLMEKDPLNFGRILPVYPLTEGLHQKSLRKIMKEIVELHSGHVDEVLPVEVIRRQELLPLSAALRQVHFPESDVDLRLLEQATTPGHRTLVFDDFFFLELGMALKRRGIALEEGIAFSVTHRYTRELLKLLPFQLTAAQRRVLSEIKEDMMAPHPMHRLVQGDVGSGKTIVALMAALVAVENEYQVAIMAPTELLAEQHYLTIHSWCEQVGVNAVLVTSASLRGKKAVEVLAEIGEGRAQIVIGTHAVIQERVDFLRMGLGIIDEQHRFGVLQRGLLKKKGTNPDILVMTATPIPRTLAMTVFGDLSLSVIDELPPGRTPIETVVRSETQRQQVYGLIRDEISAGRQAYVVYPLVEESEKSDLKAATQMEEQLRLEVFPDLRIGLLHGRLKPEEKEAVMRSFKAQELDILVATTVIEVGIDVPNATVMLVEHAERFGLSQLHQLRGRVGRGSARSRCILLAGYKQSDEARMRLQVMAATTDGFRIAEADLEIRGPGDFLGVRQAGLPDFRVGNILRDGRILEEARKEAFALVEAYPDLTKANTRLTDELVRRWGGRLELAGIA
jgi:ATP-dependent DNA helicase RecG